MNKLFLLLTSFIICYNVSAQNLQVKGRVLSGKDGIEYANVLLQTKDSVFVTGGITDKNGRFILNHLTAGNYMLKISCLGYNTKTITLNQLTNNKDLNNIQLDSANVTLNEVVIKASCIVNQDDRKIYLPTAHQIKSSTNGIDILMQMKLNRLKVDYINKKITSSNIGDVQLRVNGVKSDINDIRAIRPEDIQRIEYHEDPSLKYGDNVAVVIDYITKIRQSGGNVGIELEQSPHIGFGNYSTKGKINYKNSEWSLYYTGMYRDFNGYWRNNYESFNYNDGSNFIREEEGEPGKLNENHHFMTLNYSYRKDEKWSFVSRFRGKIDGNGTITNSYLYPIKQYNNGVNMIDDSKFNCIIPSLDLYFQRKYPKNQSLILNAVATYIKSDDSRYYHEKRSNTNLTDITSIVKGNKYSFIAEGIYEKKFKKGKLSTGFNLYNEFSKNTYSGNVMTNNNLHATFLNYYTEWSGKVNKFNYRLSAGGIFVRYSQKDICTKMFLPTARIKLGYRFSDDLNLRWNSRLNYSAPRLGDASEVIQIIDSLQIRKGNPKLRESSIYSTNMMLNYNKGMFGINLNLFYQYQKNPIMESIYIEDNKFIHTMNNQNNWQKFNPELEFNVGPIKDILNFSVSGGLNYFDSNGIDYHHTYTNFYYRIQASAMYKNWVTILQIQNRENDFYGESIKSGEAYHTLTIRYNHKNFSLGLMTFNPFSGKNNYKRPSETRNKYVTAKSCWYLRESSRLYVATLSWNFSFGRKYKSVERLLNNEDTNTSTMKTGK